MGTTTPDLGDEVADIREELTALQDRFERVMQERPPPAGWGHGLASSGRLPGGPARPGHGRRQGRRRLGWPRWPNSSMSCRPAATPPPPPTDPPRPTGGPPCPHDASPRQPGPFPSAAASATGRSASMPTRHRSATSRSSPPGAMGSAPCAGRTGPSTPAPSDGRAGNGNEMPPGPRSRARAHPGRIPGGRGWTHRGTGGPNGGHASPSRRRRVTPRDRRPSPVRRAPGATLGALPPVVGWNPAPGRHAGRSVALSGASAPGAGGVSMTALARRTRSGTGGARSCTGRDGRVAHYKFLADGRSQARLTPLARPSPGLRTIEGE